jgi:hypothetical protein
MEKIVAFDIPAQPLASALQAFGAMTQIELFYESDLVMGRRSFPLRAEMRVESALGLLLKGTGLATASFSRDTITIVAVSKPDAAELTQIKTRTVQFYPYLAVLQESLSSAFCKTPATPADPVEVLARLWIGPSGKVSRAELLSSTGSDARDRAYAVALGALAIAAPPPAAMPQPVTLMILPKRSGEAGSCVGSDQASRSTTHE